MKKSAILGGVMMAAAAATAVSAQPFESWKKMPQGWNIFFNEATSGCFMEFETNEGYVLQIGTEAVLFGRGANHRLGFLSIYAPGDLGDGHSGEQSLVDVSINAKEYQMTAVEVKRDGYTGGYVVGTATGLGQELAKARTMQILTPTTKVNVNISELKTGEAMEELATCQARKGGKSG